MVDVKARDLRTMRGANDVLPDSAPAAQTGKLE